MLDSPGTANGELFLINSALNEPGNRWSSERCEAGHAASLRTAHQDDGNDVANSAFGLYLTSGAGRERPLGLTMADSLMVEAGC